MPGWRSWASRTLASLSVLRTLSWFCSFSVTSLNCFALSSSCLPASLPCSVKLEELRVEFVCIPFVARLRGPKYTWFAQEISKGRTWVRYAKWQFKRHRTSLCPHIALLLSQDGAKVAKKLQSTSQKVFAISLTALFPSLNSAWNFAFQVFSEIVETYSSVTFLEIYTQSRCFCLWVFELSMQMVSLLAKRAHFVFEQAASCSTNANLSHDEIVIVILEGAQKQVIFILTLQVFRSSSYHALKLAGSLPCNNDVHLPWEAMSCDCRFVLSALSFSREILAWSLCFSDSVICPCKSSKAAACSACNCTPGKLGNVCGVFWIYATVDPVNIDSRKGLDKATERLL